MTVSVRRARSIDRDACVALLGALGAATGGSISPRAAAVFDDLLDDARGAVLVAYEGDRLLGLASVSFNVAMRYGGEYCQLEELIVDPQARGKQVGARLVEATLQFARERGCAEYGLYLVASTEHNRAFYERFGLRVVGTEMRLVLVD